jgi:putative two-component system response regulator
VNHRVRALELGADDFLAKPVEMIELMARVRSLLKVKAYNDYRLEYQSRLEAEVAAKTEEIKRALETAKGASLETIYRLSKASEYKDEDTGEHILRISHYTSAIARGLGFSGQDIETLLYAAPMHDIGKIGIPDYILLKPAKLDEAEWEIMKQHTVIGARILSQSSSGFMSMAEVIAISHHERWDGSGYPHGLKGEDIPLVGRITAMADVFDALTSKRPYKEAFPVDKAFSILREGSGTHFDPSVVEAFFRVQDEILHIKKTFQDSVESLFTQMHKLALQNLVDPKAPFVVGAKKNLV